MQPELISTSLLQWSELIDALITDGRYSEALLAIRAVLKRLPQHLATYQRLLQVAWSLKRWEEGDDWGARLLRADPGNALAWRAMASAAEQRGQRGQARAIWQRAFESDPYEPEIRMGMFRTGLHEAQPLALNQACLAMLTMRGRRWERAAELYAVLSEANPQRNDFRMYRMLSLWQSGAGEKAYALAQRIVRRDRFLLLPWLVLDTLGDDNDRALARQPLHSMDPNGEYVQGWFGIEASRPDIEISVTPAEADLLKISFPLG